MKQTKRILIAGIVLILLVAAVFVVLALLPRDEQNKVLFPKWLVQVEADSVQRVEIADGGDSFALIFPDGKTVIEGYEGFPLTSDATQNFRSAASQIHAYDTVDSSGEKKAEFGIDAPTRTITIVTTGKTYLLYIGAATPSGDAHYLATDDGPQIYAVKDSDLLLLLQTRYELINTQINSLPTDTEYRIDYFRVTYHGETTFAFEVIEDDDPVYANAGGLFKITAPFRALGRDVNLISFLKQACNATASTVRSLDVSDSSLASLGLLEPAGIVEYSYRGQPFTIYVSEPENGFSNVMVKGYDVVYLALAYQFGLYNFDPMDYVNVNQFKRDINDVSRILLTTPDGEYAYDLSVDGGKVSATGNGQELSGDAFTSFYKLLTTSSVVGEADDPGTGETIRMVFRYQTSLNRENDVVVFKPINDRQYFLEVNGQGAFYVSSAYVAKVRSCAKALQNGEAFDITI